MINIKNFSFKINFMSGEEYSSTFNQKFKECYLVAILLYPEL